MFARSAFIFLCGILSLAQLPVGAFDLWREASYEDFADGTFDDAGANTYISKAGRMQTVNRWDVNGDGYIDILCANSHPLVEMLDMSIYWGDGKDFSIKNHTYVPADGPMWVAPGDLNADGATDLVVANYSNGTWTSMDSAVYWGAGKNGPAPAGSTPWEMSPFNARTHLPGKNAQGVVIADFNKDGHQDIAFAFSGGFWEYRGNAEAGESPSVIYWNDGTGFSPERKTDVPAKGATDVDVADFNQDSWPDLILANGDGENSYLYFGGQDGFAKERMARLPSKAPHAVRAADINQDGWIDVLFAIGEGHLSYGYLNNNGTFDTEKRLEFETHAAKDVVVADFNKDGHNDVFFTSHFFALDDDIRTGSRIVDSYLYFGGADGFSKENRQGLQTIGAWGANAADLNGDGWVDLLVCNFQEHYSYEVPSFVYWNGPQGFDETKRTPLYEHGAQGNAITDFNGDGHLDILITSMMGSTRGDYDPNYLYFGDAQGQYSVDRRISLMGRETYEQGMADLDDDGQVDILLQNQGEVTRLENELWIYWNKDNKFSEWRITGLPCYGALSVEPVDLDRDGYLDVIISSGRNYPPKQKELEKASTKENVGLLDADPGSFIYWGNANGWAVTERTVLNIAGSRGPSIGDLNEDGHLDLLFAGASPSIFFGDGSREYPSDRRQLVDIGKPGPHLPEIADVNKDGHLDLVFANNGDWILICHGDGTGAFPKEKMTTVKIQAKTMNIADVNGDGWLDLICPFYKVKGNRSVDSMILLGGPEGYAVERSIKMFADGGTGAIASDFNFDGYTDVFWFCHRKDGSPDRVGDFGDHHTNSRLYYGGPAGFGDDNYLAIPSVGTHYDVGVDLGHIADRGFEYRYVSSSHNSGAKKPLSINWAGQTPRGTALRFQVRTASIEAALKDAAWHGAAGAGSYFTQRNSSLAGLPRGEWLQYRAVLDTGNGAISPILTAVEIAFE